MTAKDLARALVVNPSDLRTVLGLLAEHKDFTSRQVLKGASHSEARAVVVGLRQLALEIDALNEGIKS